jgi:hypothetical protein
MPEGGEGSSTSAMCTETLAAFRLILLELLAAVAATFERGIPSVAITAQAGVVIVTLPHLPTAPAQPARVRHRGDVLRAHRVDAPALHTDGAHDPNTANAAPIVSVHSGFSTL